MRDSFPNMGYAEDADDIDERIAARLKALRTERGWSLEDVAGRSGVSRATLSRLENAEVSGTAATLGRLCAAYGITMSRLISLAEADFRPLLRRADQPVWIDPDSGYHRRAVSPPAASLGGEVIEARNSE